MPLFALKPSRPGPREQLELALACGPFSRALSLAIDLNGLGLVRLKGRLDAAGASVSTTTLSYWRTGRTRPERPESLRAVALLEQELGLPDRSLTELLARPEGDRPVSVVRWERLWGQGNRMLPVLNSFEASHDASLVVLSLHESLHIGADRMLRRLCVREVVRAAEEQVQTKVVTVRGLMPDRRPRLISTRYCAPGRVEAVPGQPFTICELVLGRSLAEGETAILEYEFEYTDEIPDTSYDRRFRHPVADHLLEVHFDPATMPASCHSYRQDAPDGPEREVAEVPLSPAVPAHVITTGAAPGIHGMRWRWP